MFLYKQVPAERLSGLNGIERRYFFNHGFHRFNGYFWTTNCELGEPWRLLGNHPDWAFAKKAKNSSNS